MLLQPSKVHRPKTATSHSPVAVGRRLGSAVTGVARELDPLDVVELLVLPAVVYAVHRLDDVAKNYVEPERTLLRPRVRRP